MQGKVALITGGAKRVGAAIVRHLHGKGWQIVLHYRASHAQACALADELNEQRAQSVVCVQADLLQIDQLPKLVDCAVAHFGRLDALINNASSFFPTPLGQITEASWDDLIGSNVKAPLFLSQAAAAELKKTGGCIVSIADIHVNRPMPEHAVYSIGKAGLVTMTQALARDLAPQVRVNAVAPGANLWPDAESVFDAEQRAQIESSIPLGRVGSPLDLARTIAFLIEDAPYITGQIINVDGGRSVYL